MAKKDNLIDFLDTVFVVDGEMIKDNGEDSYAYSVNEQYGLIGVFDGCGGIGSRKYDVYSNKTGAFISSHTIAKTISEWFDRFSENDNDLSGDNVKVICSELEEVFTEELRKLESGAAKTMIKGSLTKSFPTPASFILFQKRDRGLYTSFVWAGDSRGFILNSTGLAQITQDDIDEGEDALSILSNDSRLTNVV